LGGNSDVDLEEANGTRGKTGEEHLSGTVINEHFDCLIWAGEGRG